MKRNKKGFTLVELLAVIVVLAIIMIIAIPSVMESMNNARRNSFAIYAQKVMNTVQAKVQSDLLSGNTVATCYTLPTLMGTGVGNYTGHVNVTNPNSDNPTYTLYLSDNNYSYTGATAGNIDVSNIDGTYAKQQSTCS